MSAICLDDLVSRLHDDIRVTAAQKNENLFKPVAQTTTNDVGTSITLIPGPVTTEEKAQKKNDAKARSMLLMALPNEHLMTFNQYKDAKTLFAAIQARFGVNEATKKTQKTLLNQPNESQIAHKDLVQIHKDDLEEMDLKWQLVLLSMSTRRFFYKTGRKITINGNDTAGYDKNQDSSKRTENVEKAVSNAMVAIDGAGFDWSFMTDDEVPTNMALMDFSKSEVHTDKNYSKTCLKSFKTLKKKYDDLRIEFNRYEFNLATYKRGIASVKEQLIFYKKNDVIFYEQIAVLKRDISYKDSEISMLKSELEKFKQEKESNQLKIENFNNASKSLDKLIRSQIPNNSKKGLGYESYHVVPPPPTRLFSPPKLDLSNSGLEEFQQPKFEGYGPKTSKSVSEDISNEVKESPEKKTIFPTVAKI
nr:ribonuclease H-like domain-containing protein [Tanacetum cinerariifolium]